MILLNQGPVRQRGAMLHLGLPGAPSCVAVEARATIKQR
ncbi:MAG: hypothetical protein KatS3mg059_0038 [Thermomicrobiales bacterium]|nr:MAG: hypothetical protein KatS3mg059_0038 [Thermomicrobiales bacterium]